MEGGKERGKEEGRSYPDSSFVKGTVDHGGLSLANRAHAAAGHIAFTDRKLEEMSGGSSQLLPFYSGQDPHWMLTFVVTPSLETQPKGVS